MRWGSRHPVAIASFAVIAIALLAACSTHESSVTPAAPVAPSSSVHRAGQWSAHVFVTFQEGPSGGEPIAGLTRDNAGNLFGTTVFGGDQSCQSGFDVGCGVVFKLDRHNRETILYSLTDGNDGETPVAGVVRDPAGNLYATSLIGIYNYGAAFEVSPKRK
jgi:uncharacterized repeat protein (TIGR03803 family)